MLSENYLKLESVTKSFYRWGQEVKALDSVSVNIKEGEWVMLLGHNGSGKTTLLNAISARLKPDLGEVFIEGRSISGLSAKELSRYTFHVHQDPLLGTAPTLTLFENLFIADQSVDAENSSRHQLKDKYLELLRPIGLQNRLKQLARNLSGGERQLIALLIAQLRPSKLMLLDEPLSALDPNRTDLCLEQIRKLHTMGKTILQVTHDISLALQNGNRIIMMNNGKILYDKTSDYDVQMLRDLWATNYNGDNFEKIE